MKINNIILSIPPYISTSWEQVAAVYIEYKQNIQMLVIELVSGNKVEIPNLDEKILETVFIKHSHFLENKPKDKPSVQPPADDNKHGIITFSMPIPADGSTLFMQHNIEQAQAPDLPKEILDKVVLMTKNLKPEELANLSKAEPHCNCPYCQIMKAIQSEFSEPEIEEAVTDSDLTFRSWEIHQETDKLYTVTSPLDTKEQYHVFLGSPIGCTCGNKNCEHIQAVLKS